MIGLKNMFDAMEITILNAELLRVGREWNYRHVNNPYSRIYYITEGNGSIEHHGRLFSLRPRHLYLIPCYTTVDMACEEGFEHYYIHFTSRLGTGLDILSIFECSYEAPTGGLVGRSLFERLLELNPNKELTDYNANRPIYKQVLERAQQLDQDQPPSRLLETNALMRLLLAVFFREHSHPQVMNALCGLRRFERVLEHIREHLDAPITVGELAELSGLNPTYFSNLFSKLIGISPLQYINKRRIEKAQELLLGTDETLWQIAREVGFRDEYYFSRMFKKIVGISPDHYRKQEAIIHSYS